MTIYKCRWDDHRHYTKIWNFSKEVCRWCGTQQSIFGMKWDSRLDSTKETGMRHWHAASVELRTFAFVPDRMPNMAHFLFIIWKIRVAVYTIHLYCGLTLILDSHWQARVHFTEIYVVLKNYCLTFNQLGDIEVCATL